MRLLVVGDLHLYGDQSSMTVPDAWDEYDAIVLVGDVLDSRAESAAPAAAFLAQLTAREPPVLAVPGNHDYRRFESLVENYPSVRNLHRTSTCVDGYRFYGYGAMRFDAGPAVRYPHTDAFDTSSYDALRVAVDRAARPHTTRQPKSTPVQDQLALYRARIRALAEIAPDESAPRILVSHLPPFDSGLDTLAPNHPRYPNRPWGSLAVRTHIETHGPTAVCCGHVHEAEGTTKIDGTTCLNAGFASAYTVCFQPDAAPVVEHTATLQ